MTNTDCSADAIAELIAAVQASSRQMTEFLADEAVVTVWLRELAPFHADDIRTAKRVVLASGWEPNLSAVLKAASEAAELRHRVDDDLAFREREHEIRVEIARERAAMTTDDRLRMRFLIATIRHRDRAPSFAEWVTPELREEARLEALEIREDGVRLLEALGVRQ